MEEESGLHKDPDPNTDALKGLATKNKIEEESGLHVHHDPNNDAQRGLASPIDEEENANELEPGKNGGKQKISKQLSRLRHNLSKEGRFKDFSIADITSKFHLSRRRLWEPHIYDKGARDNIGQIISWPNVFKDSISMLEFATLVYSINSLRDAARKGHLENIESIFELPIHFNDMLDLLDENHDIILKHMPVDAPYLLDPLENLLIRQSAQSLGHNMRTSKLSHELLCIAYNDHNHEKELVYGIFKDEQKERVVVSFRGTTTFQDMKQDLKVATRKISNPLAHIEGQSEHVRVFAGVYNYLFKKIEDEDTVDAEKGDAPRKTKYDEIFRQVREIFDENPTYELYITGHSLGGALATLFTFFIGASRDKIIPKPVSCVSFAAPKVGNINFRRVFQYMEHHGMARHMRVHNSIDPVPPTPPMIPALFLHPKNIYHHVGISFQLKTIKGKYRIKYKYLRKIGCGLYCNYMYKVLLHETTICCACLFPCIMPRFARAHGIDVYNENLRTCYEKNSKDVVFSM